MKNNSARPHLGNCPVCEQGLIHIARCPECEEWSAVCDDCEAVWKDPAQVFQSPPDSQHPECPHCGAVVSKWSFGSRKQLHNAGFDHLFSREAE